MALIASQVTKKKALDKIMERALYIRSMAQRAVARLATNTGADYILALLDELNAGRAELNSYASTPDLAGYARDQLNSPSYDVVTEYGATMAAMQNVSAWVVANFPKDANGFVLSHTMDAEGVRTPRQFTPAQTSGLVTQLNALISTIA